MDVFELTSGTGLSGRTTLQRYQPKIVWHLAMYFILFQCALPGMLQAQALKGSILDKSNGQPIAFAHIYIKATSTGTTSDIDGKFLLDPISGNADTIIVSHVNYVSQQLSIRIDSPAIIYLDPINTVLPEMVVIAGEDAGGFPSFIEVFCQRIFQNN